MTVTARSLAVTEASPDPGRDGRCRCASCWRLPAVPPPPRWTRPPPARSPSRRRRPISSRRSAYWGQKYDADPKNRDIDLNYRHGAPPHRAQRPGGGGAAEGGDLLSRRPRGAGRIRQGAGRGGQLRPGARRHPPGGDAGQSQLAAGLGGGGDPRPDGPPRARRAISMRGR